LHTAVARALLLVNTRLLRVRSHNCKQKYNNAAIDVLGRAKSPTKRVASSSRPPSASTASSSVAPSPAPVHNNEVNGGWKSGQALQSSTTQPLAPPQQPPKRQRPSELRTKSSGLALILPRPPQPRRPPIPIPNV
jgi:hypothetical protein